MIKTMDVKNKEYKLITNNLGRQFWIESGDKFYEQRFSSGPYQVRNLKFARRCYPNKPVIIDIGMNIANNTIEYASWASKVYSFEPFKTTYEVGIKNIELNKPLKLTGRYTYNHETGCVTHEPTVEYGWWQNEDGSYASRDVVAEIIPHNVGLGNKKEKVLMEDHPNNAGHNCVLTEHRKKISKYEKREAEIEKLDNFKFEKVDFIKVDVEGFEYNVLLGGFETIKKLRPTVQLEMVESQCKKFNYKPQYIVDYFLMKIGDYVYCDYRGKDLGTKWNKLKGVMDYFFVPREVFSKINNQSNLDKFFGNEKTPVNKYDPKVFVETKERILKAKEDNDSDKLLFELESAEINNDEGYMTEEELDTLKKL